MVPTSGVVVAAHLGVHSALAGSVPLQVFPCKPAAVAPRLRVYAGRDAAALMGTRPGVSGGEGARTPQRTDDAMALAKQALNSPELRREVSGNLRRLFAYREMFGEDFVGRQCWVCLKLLGGLAAEF
ncbi:hypothetical protein [Noviherbaspirillum sp.]|uniref:hypothetical protein n=1 Tax=Noviherbaspirillum sp. TaxID=1926288 RepID=UPI002B48A187|nr:hypothetical protein [Noviherbaspirillum sp.]HJV82449.1 hypothetical protein [Noviherbaspirillum sp.]